MVRVHDNSSHKWLWLSSVNLFHKLTRSRRLWRRIGMVHQKNWRVVVDDRRTLQLPEIQLLVKIYRKRSMGWLIALDEPISNKHAKINIP